MTTDETMHSIVSALETLDLPHIHIDFIGGESLLPGIEYYERFEEAFSGIDTTVFIQSNGTLATAEVCEFMKKHKYRLGITFDGAPESHNVSRSNSFTPTMTGILNAKKYGVMSLVTSVISDSYIPFVEKSFSIYAILNIPMRFNPATPHADPAKYQQTMQKLVELWFDFDRPFRWSAVERVVTILDSQEWCDVTRGICTCMGDSIDIEWDGTVITCSHHASDPLFQMGNINKDPIGDILHHPNRLGFFKASMGAIQHCHDCMFRHICIGPCYSNAYSNGLDYDPYCTGGAGMYTSILERCGLSITDYKEMIPT